jgi:hypothetical protein
MAGDQRFGFFFFFKGKSDIQTDLSHRLKELRAPSHSAVFLHHPNPAPEHPVCILTAVAPGQSPLPTLPSSLSQPAPVLQSQAADLLPAARKSAGRSVRKLHARCSLQYAPERLLGCGNFLLPTRRLPGWHAPSLTRSRGPGSS